MRAIQINEFGGPHVLEVVDVAEPEPGNGQVLVHVTAAGVNHADTHHTEDSYFTPVRLPMIPGSEVVGTDADGNRTVALLPAGGYAERVVADPASCFPVPDDIDDGAAAALALQGTTAWHLLHTRARVQPGESVAVLGAAGGVGSLAVQLAKAAGAEPVVAAASTGERRDLALELGADVAIDSRAEDLTAAITDAAGAKVDVVLEMAGGRVFDQCLDALAPFGTLVLYGLASRSQPSDIKPVQLLRKSQAVAGFRLTHAFADPTLMVGEPLAELFSMVSNGELRPVVGGTYALTKAREAHTDLLARRTTGKLLLDPAR